MTRRAKNVGLSAEFDHAPGVHNRDAVRNMRNDCEIVRDEKHRQSKFMPQVIQQIENLLLYGHIERSGRLIRDQQLWTINNGHRNHHALPHSSRKLMRIAPCPLFGLRDGHIAHAFNRSSPGFGFRDAVMSEDSLGNLPADTHDRVKGGHRLLENHRNPRPAKLAKLLGRQSGKMCRRAVAILKCDFARHNRGWRKQSHDGE